MAFKPFDFLNNLLFLLKVLRKFHRIEGCYNTLSNFTHLFKYFQIPLGSQIVTLQFQFLNLRNKLLLKLSYQIAYLTIKLSNYACDHVQAILTQNETPKVSYLFKQELNLLSKHTIVFKYSNYRF